MDIRLQFTKFKFVLRYLKIINLTNWFNFLIEIELLIKTYILQAPLDVCGSHGSVRGGQGCKDWRELKY